MHMMGPLAFIVFLAVFAFFLLMVFPAVAGQTRAAKPKRVPREVAAVGQRSLAARQAAQRAGYEGGPDYVNVTDLGLVDVDEFKLVPLWVE